MSHRVSFRVLQCYMEGRGLRASDVRASASACVRVQDPVTYIVRCGDTSRIRVRRPQRSEPGSRTSRVGGGRRLTLYFT
eukprot:4512834-Prymnesium_polylepis.2